jgi:AAA15 family ATPase/GTPase
MSGADLGIAGLEMEVEPSSAALAPPNEDLQLRLMHRLGGRDVALEQDLESQGTLNYLNLLGAVVDSLRKGVPLLVDELDASLHTVLSMNLIRLFNEPGTNPKGAQLIFNTHDTSLLSSGDLRRDEIWFTEKGVDGSSHLFPLSDFKLRRSENMESGYLLGRYGAIPLVNSAALLARFADSDAVAK